MGLPSRRFLDRNYDQFICTICLDVSDDLVAVNGCDHIFCRSCIDSNELKKCPTCQAGFKDPKFEIIKSATTRVYYDLRMKRINPSCDKVLIPSDYKYHDDNCEITFDTCKDCGFRVHDEKCPVTFDTCKDCDFKARRGSKSDHFCAKVLKGDEELFIERKEVEKGPKEPSWVDVILRRDLKSHREWMWFWFWSSSSSLSPS